MQIYLLSEYIDHIRFSLLFVAYIKFVLQAEWINPNKRPPDDWPANGECKFDSYKTRYREGLDLVLKGITCDIAGGEKVRVISLPLTDFNL